MSGFHRIDAPHTHGHGHDGHHHGHGHHGHEGHHHGHGHDGLLLPSPGVVRSRRAFLGDLGKGTMAMAVFTPALLAACASDASQPAVATSDAAEEPEAPADPTAQPESTRAPDPTAEPPAEVSAEPTSQPAADGAESDLVWARSNLGFVSAYVLVRGNTAAIVDTGTAGSAEAIGVTLGDLGMNYSDVAHVVLTHHHGDHAGSIGEVLEMAVNATAYAGEADVAQISAPVTGLAGGEDVFGFEMVPTPGHTLGHMAALDHQAGLLIAGDAIFTEGGAAIEGPARFFNDVPESRRSIAAMAELTFNTLLVGHGEPIEGGADAAVATLAASFG